MMTVLSITKRSIYWLMTITLLLSIMVIPGITVRAAEPLPEFTNADREIPGLGLEVDTSFDSPYHTDDVLGFDAVYRRQTGNDWVKMELKIIYLYQIAYADTFYQYLVSNMEINDAYVQYIQKDDYYDIFDLKLETAYRSFIWGPKKANIGASERPWYTANRLIRYDDHYIITVDGEGRGFSDKDEIIQFANILEQHGRQVVAKKKGGLSLQHFMPFDYLKADGTDAIAPAGDLVATLTDGSGKPIAGKTVIFYVEPWETLPKVMRTGPNTAAVKANLFSQDTVILGVDITDKQGKAVMNYLSPNLIDMPAFFKTMQEERTKWQENGRIIGHISAAEVDMEKGTVGQKSTVFVEFKGIARIVRITGAGRSEQFKAAILKEHPDSSEWGTGRVRVNRWVTPPYFNYTPVEEQYYLHAGDIIDIDGNTEVEIVWVTGDRAIARVPDIIHYQDAEVPSTHARVFLWTSSYDSGFSAPVTALDRIKYAVLGFGVDKGLDVLVASNPYAVGTKWAGEFTIDIYQALSDEASLNQDLMVKIRVRSTVAISTAGDDIRFYNIEGSPSLLNRSGSTIDLSDGQMTTIFNDASFSSPAAFRTGNDLPEWSDIAGQWAATSGRSTTSNGGSGPGSIVIIVGITAGVIVLAVLLIFGVRYARRRKI
jgi:hypothetical protein